MLVMKLISLIRGEATGLAVALLLPCFVLGIWMSIG